MALEALDLDNVGGESMAKAEREAVVVYVSKQRFGMLIELLESVGLSWSHLTPEVSKAVAAVTKLQELRDGSGNGTPIPAPAAAPNGRLAKPKTSGGSGARPLAPGHVRHSWSPLDERGVDECVKCGMHRELLDRGNMKFVSRDGEEHLRPPFGGVTPSCDEGLLKNPRR